MTTPKNPDEWWSLLLKDWPSRAILTILTLFCGYIWSQGDSLVTKKIIDTMRPGIDSLAKKQETTDKKVDKVDEKLDALIQVMSKAFPEFKKAAKERVQENNDSRDVQDALMGGSK